MEKRDNESGQVIILTALFMTVLLGFLALGIDVAMLFRARRNVQIAADAAAIGATMDYYYNGSVSAAQTVGKADSAANGITDGVKGATVTINCPPTSGPNTSAGGCNGFFEAKIKQPNGTAFMSLFNHSSVDVGARAVAGTPGGTTACVYILDPTASSALELQGSFDMTAAKCGIVVNSNSSSAIKFTGAGGSLTAGSVSVVGGATGHTEDSTPAVVTGAAAISDPLNEPGPTPTNGKCTSTSTATSLTGVIASPSGGVVCFTKAVSLNNVTLGTGWYVFENGVTTNGTIATGAGGATIDVQNGGFNVNTGTVLNLVAPTTSINGLSSGIALMEPTGNTSQIKIQKGNATGNLTGIIYAPSAELYLQDSGGDKNGGIILTTDLIVGTLFDKTANLTINSYSLSHPTTPLKSITLVE